MIIIITTANWSIDVDRGRYSNLNSSGDSLSFELLTIADSKLDSTVS